MFSKQPKCVIELSSDSEDERKQQNKPVPPVVKDQLKPSQAVFKVEVKKAAEGDYVSVESL